MIVHFSPNSVVSIIVKSHVADVLLVEYLGLIQHAHTNSLTLSSRPQVHLSTGTKKLVAATALGAVSLLFLARHFQRRKRHKKSQSQQWEQASFQFPPPLLAEQGEELRPVRRSLPSATLRPPF